MLTVVFAGIDQTAGVGTWWRLRADADEARARIAVLQERIDRQHDEARALREDPLAQERAIRQDLGFARPGETIVRLGGRREDGPRGR